MAGADLTERNVRADEVLKKESVISSMKEIGLAISGALSLDTLLHLIMGKVTELMEADRGTLYLLDREKNELWSKVLQGDELTEIRLPVGKGIAGWVAETGEVLNIRDAYEDSRFNQEVDRKTGYRTKSVLAMPMRSREGNIIGVVQVLNKKDGFFTDYDEELLSALTFQASISLQSSILYRDIEERNIQLNDAQKQLSEKVEELDMLFEIEKEISRASFSLEKLLDIIMTKLMGFLHSEAGSILLIEEKTNELYFKIALGEKGREVKKYRLNLGEGIVGWVAQHGEPCIVNDVYLDTRFKKDISETIGFPTKTIICVPLKVGGQTIGALEMINKIGYRAAFSKDDVKLLSMIAGRVSEAIHLSRLREREAKASRLASIGQMVSGLMHDLQTPMTSILGYVELMAMDGTTDDERREYSEIIEREVDRLTGMIRANLDFAAGRVNVLLKKIGVTVLIKDIVQMLEKDFKEKGIEIETELGYRGNIRVDENKIRRAFFNLAKNAKEAMPEGGVFSIRTSDENGRVVIDFSDTGVGIPEEIRDDIFDSFVTSGKESGTGLGLAIVKKIIDEHNGTINVSSEPGRGTNFSIVLPAG